MNLKNLLAGIPDQSQDWKRDKPSSLSSATIYIASADAGSLPDEALWTIVRQVYNSSAVMIRQQIKTNAKWSERATVPWAGDALPAHTTFTILNHNGTIHLVLAGLDLHEDDFDMHGALDNNEAAKNLSDRINSDEGDILSTYTGATVYIYAVDAGIDGNNLSMYTSNKTVVNFENSASNGTGKLYGGKDATH